MASTKSYPRTWLLGLILALSLVGLADAAYLTAKHYSGGPVPCSITGGCEPVMESSWATVGGVPVAALGAVYYLVTFFLTIFYLDGRKLWALKVTFVLTAMGIAVSIALICVMAFVLHAWCQYCLLSDGVSSLLFAAACWAAVQQRRQTRAEITSSVSAR